MGAQTLDRIHHVSRLVHENHAHQLGPRQVLIHPLDHGGIVGERLHALAPKLFVDVRFVAAEGEKPCGEHDVCGGRARGQDQRDKGVGVERDGRDQFFDFLRGTFGLVAFSEDSGS
jgi:hypothetical protein